MQVIEEITSDVELLDAGVGDDLSVPKQPKPRKRKIIIPPSFISVADAPDWFCGHVTNAGLYWFYGEYIGTGWTGRLKNAVLVNVVPRKASEAQSGIDCWAYWNVLEQKRIPFLLRGCWKPAKPGILPEWR